MYLEGIETSEPLPLSNNVPNGVTLVPQGKVHLSTTHLMPLAG